MDRCLADCADFTADVIRCHDEINLIVWHQPVMHCQRQMCAKDSNNLKQLAENFQLLIDPTQLVQHEVALNASVTYNDDTLKPYFLPFICLWFLSPVPEYLSGIRCEYSGSIVGVKQLTRAGAEPSGNLYPARSSITVPPRCIPGPINKALNL